MDQDIRIGIDVGATVITSDARVTSFATNVQICRCAKQAESAGFARGRAYLLGCRSLI